MGPSPGPRAPRAASCHPQLPAPVLADRSLPHQIVLRCTRESLITVSCNCTHGKPIEARLAWGTGEARAAWRAYHERGEPAL
jgi:hypothetical protein